jgi:hypothetical protein
VRRSRRRGLRSRRPGRLRALQAERWPEHDVLWARMALHIGELEER